MPVEQQLLPSEELRPYYDQVTWLFVTRNFDGDAKDREATRTHDRFGITSWPHLLVFDPRDDRVLGRLARELPDFLRGLDEVRDVVPGPSHQDRRTAQRIATARERDRTGDRTGAERILEQIAQVPDGVGAWLEARELLRDWRGDQRDLTQRLADPDVRERAIAIEELSRATDQKVDPEVLEAVTQTLFDPDEHLVVRIRALDWTARRFPDRVAGEAGALLEVTSDSFRNTVLSVLKERPNPELAELLSTLFREAGSGVPSNNPNVLRRHVAECMVDSGDATAIDAVADLVREANPLNGTTSKAIQALAGIAPRVPKVQRNRIVTLLVESFPAALDDTGSVEVHPALARSTEGLVRELRETVGRVSGVSDLPVVPAGWSAAEREDFLSRTVRHLRRTP